MQQQVTDKVNYLIQKFSFAWAPTKTLVYRHAIECSIIFCDEMINEFEGWSDEQVEFYTQVKTELVKLQVNLNKDLCKN